MQGPAGQHHACPCLGIDHRTTGVDPILPIGRYLGTVPTSTAASTASTAHCDCYDPAFAQFLHDAGCRSDSTLDQDSRDMTSGYLSHAHILAFSHSRIIAFHPSTLSSSNSFCSFLFPFPPFFSPLCLGRLIERLDTCQQLSTRIPVYLHHLHHLHHSPTLFYPWLATFSSSLHTHPPTVVRSFFFLLLRASFTSSGTSGWTGPTALLDYRIHMSPPPPTTTLVSSLAMLPGRPHNTAGLACMTSIFITFIIVNLFFFLIVIVTTIVTPHTTYV